MKIKVSDMMCHHCEEKITSALKREGISCTIDLENKIVEVADDEFEDAKEIITKTGYNVE